MSARLALAAAAVLVVAAPALAAAQSTRHPPPPVDAEAEQEARSEFWEEVVRPGAKRYDQLVAAASEILRMRVGDWNRARGMMLEATALRPDLVDGWGYLGVAARRIAMTAGQNAKASDWKQCADAYGKAYALDPAWTAKRLGSKSDPSAQIKAEATAPIELGWATCLARTGDIDAATESLEVLVARGVTTPDLWLRLGEVYMAAGRLGEAITALENARNDRITDKRVRWLLALAYDRARRPGEADAVLDSVGDVTNVTRLSDVQFVPASDAWYLQAYGWRSRPGRALALFRTYLAKAPAETPWRARAQEHVDALLGVDLASYVDIQGTGDRAAIEKSVRAAMPALRRCVASVPEVYVELRITQLGPVKPLPPPKPVLIPRRGGAGHYRAPGPVIVPQRSTTLLQPGVFAEPIVYEPGVADTARHQALECLEKLGLTLSLPRPPANTYSNVRIPVVADG
jgi:tetratricopeptide (TPR) repeat protein